MEPNKYLLLLLISLNKYQFISAKVTCDTSDYLICYEDNEDGLSRVLNYGPYDLDGGVTIEGCMERCYAFGLIYSGVEFGNQCFCGNDLQSPLVEVDVSECQSTPCAGNDTTFCGGTNRISIYNTSCTGQVVPNYFGCQDDTSRALPYCDSSLSIDDRFENFKSILTLSEKILLISPQEELGNTCNCHTGNIDRIGLPQFMWLTETNTAVASSCIKKGQCASEFSGPMSLGASFNKTSWYLKGHVFGTEQRAYMNINWHRGTGLNDYIGLTAYGPNINNQRDPRFGRSSELPGEDSYLSGIYASEMLSGMMEKDSQKQRPKVLPYLKHFTAYSRETDRGHDTYNISQHDLYETYLSQYKLAFSNVQGVGAMCSYNGINGSPSCSNDKLLNEILRHEFGQSEAHITTDCGAVSNLLGDPINAMNDTYATSFSINNGSDIEMGGTLWANNLELAINIGLTSEAVIDAALERGYKPHFVAGRFDDPADSDWYSLGLSDINSDYHKQIVHEAALQGLVLLKNENDLLPLPFGTTTNTFNRAGESTHDLESTDFGDSPFLQIAVVGPQGIAQAGLFSDYENDESCFGGGHDCIETIFEAIQKMNAASASTSTSTSMGADDDDGDLNKYYYLTQFSKGVDVDSMNNSGIPDALSLAENSDVVILVLGITKDQEEETKDRTDTNLPGLQNDFAHQVLALGKPTIMILTNGGQLAIDSFVESTDASSSSSLSSSVRYPNVIIEAFNPNGVGASAIAESLFATSYNFEKNIVNNGVVINHWGKLPYTLYPHDYIYQQSMTNYDMSIAPGRTYKYYNEIKYGKVLYPFGYGLSYTNFQLQCFSTDLKSLNNQISFIMKANDDNDDDDDKTYSISCSLQNIGNKYSGDEIIMVYHNVSSEIRSEANHPIPLKALVDFDRYSNINIQELITISYVFNQSIFNVIDENGQDKLYNGVHTLIFTNGVSETVELSYDIQN